MLLIPWEVVKVYPITPNNISPRRAAFHVVHWTVLENINHPGVRRVNQELVTAHPAESSAEFVVAGKKFTGVYNLGVPIYLRLDGLQVSITSKPTRFFPV
jgi:hypothetical protein